MCLPAAAVAGVSTALSAVSVIGGWMAQKQQAKQQEAAYAANAKGAANDAEFQRVQLARQRVGEIAGITQRITQINTQEVGAESEAIVSATEGGVGGGVLDDIMQQVNRDAAQARNVEQSNADAVAKNAQFADVSIEADRINRTNSVKRGQDPGILGLITGLGQVAVKAYDKFDNISTRKKLLNQQTTVKNGTSEKVI